MSTITYVTEKSDAGWTCDLCGQITKRSEFSPPSKCRYCQHRHLTFVRYFPTHEAAREYAR